MYLMQGMQGALNLGHDGLVVGLDAVQPAVKGGRAWVRQKQTWKGEERGGGG